MPGWAPRYPRGGTPALAEGVSFQTDADGGIATWLVTRYDPDARRASYAYVLPGHRATGDAFVRGFAEGFAEQMAEWARAIARAHPRG